MRIAYVALHLQEVIMQGGVGQKIAAQLNIWQEMGHEDHFFLHTPDASQYPHTSLFPYQGISQFKPLRNISREIPRSLSLKRMIESIKAYQPDIIYLRYGLYAWPLQALFEIAPVVVEINGDDVNEYRHRGFVYYLTNRITRNITLGKASGMVHTSQEISRLASNTRFEIPSIVIANGIDMREYPPLPAPDNPGPRLSMVCSAGYNWHGIDKLMYLAEQCPDLTFDVIGHALGEETSGLPNVHYHGFLNKEQVREVLAYSDVSLGTLALHRKTMEEASPLKVREALAYGIPTILAYQDTDLEGVEYDVLCRIPNHEDNVRENVEEIRSFAYRMKGKRVDKKRIEPCIDQVVKEIQRLEFFQSIYRHEKT